MPNIRVEYTNEGEEVIIDRDVVNLDGVEKAFDDIGQLIGLPSKGLRQSYDSIYDGVDIDVNDTTDEQFTFHFDEEGDGQKISPFERVVADQVEWNERLKQNDYLPNQDFYVTDPATYVTDRPAQPTLRIDSDESDKFYYNGT